jgi:hypothetical protein
VLVPVDGSYTLDIDGMMEVLAGLNARLMIPMHYFGQSTLERFPRQGGRELRGGAARRADARSVASDSAQPRNRHDPAWTLRSGMEDETRAATRLLSASAVRERCERLFTAGLDNTLDHLALDLDRLGGAVDEVAATIRTDYPTLDIPYHARWRHFCAGGFDRWEALDGAAPWTDPHERGRAAFDLAIVSVLLDAGAGPSWRYEEGRTGEVFTRSEGLAVASFDLFVGGAFSGQPEEPWRADADALAELGTTELARGMQVSAQNPMVGLEGRAKLLNALGRAVAAKPDVFARDDEPRPGGLFDWLVAQAPDGAIAAPTILEAVLEHFGPVWPGRIAIGDVELGDTWRHPRAGGDGATAGLVPFHKLSQWLTYSLVEPLQQAGLRVSDLDGLTGLPEYRNGGLFLDTGVLRLKDDRDAERPHEVGSALVVEWRALTVALLDRTAAALRERLGLSADAFPLAKVLQGGTWSTGRRLAAAKRPGGAPPIQVISDGTVF